MTISCYSQTYIDSYHRHLVISCIVGNLTFKHLHHIFTIIIFHILMSWSQTNPNIHLHYIPSHHIAFHKARASLKKQAWSLQIFTNVLACTTSYKGLGGGYLWEWRELFDGWIVAFLSWDQSMNHLLVLMRELCLWGLDVWFDDCKPSPSNFILLKCLPKVHHLRMRWWCWWKIF